jgi:hypothetical protein
LGVAYAAVLAYKESKENQSMGKSNENEDKS